MRWLILWLYSSRLRQCSSHQCSAGMTDTKLTCTQTYNRLVDGLPLVLLPCSALAHGVPFDINTGITWKLAWLQTQRMAEPSAVNLDQIYPWRAIRHQKKTRIHTKLRFSRQKGNLGLTDGLHTEKLACTGSNDLNACDGCRYTHCWYKNRGTS